MKKSGRKLLALALCLALCAGLLTGTALAAETVYSNHVSVADGKHTICKCDNMAGNDYHKLRDIAYLVNGTGSQFSFSRQSSRFKRG